jgi:stress response protein YsnF
MTTLTPPETKLFPDDSIEKKVYNLVDLLSEYLPVANDRNRLGFSLYKYVIGEGDEPAILVKSTKVKIEGISPEELTNKLNIGVEKIKSEMK